ncbi:unnamed protein product [Thlaspi arvense]|uniref:CHCH domain-containing protein n=1 Tax=Thlaspi arvense TaxID=13288 RepID=A0AAU9SYQ8_THLAR|nr:unnamed protein product [Thlaspi arvense]
MPRRSSGGRSAPRPRPAAARSPPPQTVNRAPPPATAQPNGGGSVFGSIGSTIADGMAWGTGNAVAHRVMDSVMGPRTFKHETVVSQAAPASSPVPNSTDSGSCDTHSKAFQDCVNNFGSDISKCQFYMDMLSECRKNAAGSMMAA